MEKVYTCECGTTFDDPQKFNTHKSHCKIHFESNGIEYSMKNRVQKQKETIIEKYGSLEEYSRQHSEKIKNSFKDRTDTVDYVVSHIDKDEFIHDYIAENKPRSFMRQKYDIPSDYMMDVIVKKFDCKKDKKQSSKLGWATKYAIYPADNVNNWKKGHETRIKNSGSIKESYMIGLEKQKETMIERYGIECLFNDPSIVTHRKKKDTGPNNKFASILKSHHIDFTQEFVLQSKSYDFAIDDILIEIDPIATHNAYRLPYPPYKGLDKEYHKNKTQTAEKCGYRCIHVWDWDNADMIVTLLENRDSIYGRDCQVKEISKIECDDFLNAYHLQGSARSNFYIGLFYHDDLVSVMTFGKPRYNMNYEYELIRYCSKCNVVGGSQKLFTYFIRNMSPKSIISYCDRSKFTGAVYKNLGFSYIGSSLGRHWYNPSTGVHITDNLLRQRGFDQLLGSTYGCFGKGTSNEELMYQHGFLDLYDCGQDVYIWCSSN